MIDQTQSLPLPLGWETKPALNAPAERKAIMAGVAEPEPGEVFAGRYEIQRLLGEGDRKRTYLARDQKVDRQVAVSLVKPDAIAADPEGTEREAKVLGRIGSHANIVSLYDYEMNTDGGTLLIRVDDSGNALGIEADLKYLGKDKRNADGWLLSLRDVIIKALGTEVWGAIHASLVRRGEKTVTVVQCPPRASETWHSEDGGERFYIRAANATQELSGSHLVRYVRERWPG